MYISNSVTLLYIILFVILGHSSYSYIVQILLDIFERMFLLPRLAATEKLEELEKKISLILTNSKQIEKEVKYNNLSSPAALQLNFLI